MNIHHTRWCALFYFYSFLLFYFISTSLYIHLFNSHSRDDLSAQHEPIDLSHKVNEMNFSLVVYIGNIDIHCDSWHWWVVTLLAEVWFVHQFNFSKRQRVSKRGKKATHTRRFTSLVGLTVESISFSFLTSMLYSLLVSVVHCSHYTEQSISLLGDVLLLDAQKSHRVFLFPSRARASE